MIPPPILSTSDVDSSEFKTLVDFFKDWWNWHKFVYEVMRDEVESLVFADDDRVEAVKKAEAEMRNDPQFKLACRIEQVDPDVYFGKIRPDLLDTNIPF